MLNVFAKKIKTARKNYLATQIQASDEKRKKRVRVKKNTQQQRLNVYTKKYEHDKHILELYTSIQSNAPAHNQLPEDFDQEKHFKTLPISEETKKGLTRNGFQTLTPIQKATLPHSLAERDVLGAAQTGSGKTLAFLIPILEKLYREKWSSLDGLGALIISPTKELAIQIFEVLRQIGFHHDLSAGLLTGGGGEKRVKEESERVHGMNIVVCTPSRLLQHLDQAPSFNVSNLQILVLDEADRMLEMGFQETLEAILHHLPQERQTLLFSATQTTDINDLSRVGMKNPEYISVDDVKESPIPKTLNQYVITCELEDKMNTLWSFLKTHKKHKMLVFFSTRKQVKFVYEAFKMLRPGIPIQCLYGNQSAEKRMELFYDFCSRKHCALFTTDVGARGLDFPNVDWVFQVDRPDDPKKYIHRVGRTARLDQTGNSLLLLLPQEKDFLETLNQHSINVKELKVNPNANQDVSSSLASVIIKRPELAIDAKKAFTLYLRGFFYQQNENTEKFQLLNLKAFSESLGLAVQPVISFTEDSGQEKGVFGFQKLPTLTPQEILDMKANKKTKFEKLVKTTNQKPMPAFEPEGEPEDFLKVKKESLYSQLPEDFQLPKPVANQHTEFDSDEDDAKETYKRFSEDDSDSDNSDDSDNSNNSDDSDNSDDFEPTEKNLKKPIKKMKMEDLEEQALLFLKN